MNAERADVLWLTALRHALQYHPDVVAEANAMTPGRFLAITSTEFLEHYVWVVFASGFKASIVLNKFDAIRRAFKGFDLPRMARIRSLRPALKVFNSVRKCQNVVDGAKLIAGEGFEIFRGRILTEGPDGLISLPGIGPIVKDHLAKNIGLADVEKNDIWVERAAAYCETTPSELIDRYVADGTYNRHAADCVLWLYLSDEAGGLIAAASKAS